MEVVHGEVCGRDTRVLRCLVHESHDVVGARDDLDGGGEVHHRQTRKEQDVVYVVRVVDEANPAIQDEVAAGDVEEQENQSRTDYVVAYP